jgi:hypothetical protein
MARASFDPYYRWLGIPPEEQPPNYYRLLGIPLFESDLDVIENAAHRQMVYIRTFQTGKNADLSQKLLNELAAAKVCLMSRSKRAAYDESLRRLMSGESAGGELAGGESGDGGAVDAGVGDSGSNVEESESFGDVSGAQESGNGVGDSSESGNSVGPLLDFTRPATERRERPRGKRQAKQTKRVKQPLVAILLLFGGLGVIAVFLIVLLLVLMFRKPKDGPNAGQASGQAAGNPIANPNELTGNGTLGTGAFGTGAFAGGESGGKSANNVGKSPKPDPSVPAVSGGPTPNATSPAMTGAPAENAGKTVLKPGTPGNQGDAKVPATGAGESNPGATAGSSDDKRLERIRAQFAVAQEALVARDAIKAQSVLGGLGSLNRDPALREEKERLEAISRFVGEFWKSVRSGAGRVKGRLGSPGANPGSGKNGSGKNGGGNNGGNKNDQNKSDQNKSDDSKAGDGKAGDGKAGDGKAGDGKAGDSKAGDGKAGDGKAGKRDASGVKDQAPTDNTQPSENEPPPVQELEFLGEVFGVADEGTRAEFTLNGEPWTAPLFDLPPKAAVALALLSMNDSDGFGRFYAAAFLLVDQKGDPVENRELGMAIYRQAEMLAGEPNAFIFKQFELDEESLAEAADKFPPDKLKVRQRPKTPSEGGD